MGKAFNYERAEQEANKIGLEFANSNDVVKDMSRAYNVDFSNIKVHTDSAADNKVKAAGKDALAQGNDIFFGKGIFESSDPADKGLVAHEFAHTMQQGAAMGGEMAVAESAPMGVAQGGLGSWFKRHFTHKGRVARRAEKKPMADMNTAINGIFAGAGEAPQMAAGVTPVRTVSHEEFQHQKNAEALRGVAGMMRGSTLGQRAILDSPEDMLQAEPFENVVQGTWAGPEEITQDAAFDKMSRTGLFDADASANAAILKNRNKKEIKEYQGWKDEDIAWWI
ncbi:MAG: DUF4157 domain-containing protein [Anaerotignum sp.]|nr:DUF4157 domain-containing protein [Anaerotignum sp.]